MMNKVQIKWHDLDDESSVNLEDFTGFYILVGENVEDEECDEVDLLDISMAYKENILEKIDNPLDTYEFLREYLAENPEMDIFYMMGVIEDSSIKPVTRDFLKDINCLLIGANSPLFNELCEEPEEGSEAEPIHLTNTGDYQPLEEISELN